jgi:hypothetical protein
MVERVLLDLMRMLAQDLIVGQNIFGHGFAAAFRETASGGIDGKLELWIGDGLFDIFSRRH